MNVLLTHFYSRRNYGDAAITSVMIKELKRIDPKVEITIMSMDKTNNSTFEGVSENNSFFYEAIYASRINPLRVLRTAFIIVVSLIWVSIYHVTRKKINIILPRNIIMILENYLWADTIIGVGGGYLLGDNTMRGNITLLLHLHSILVAQLLDKPVILYSQSVGPFSNFIQKFFVKEVLNKTQLVMIRENISLQILKDIGVKEKLLTKAIDAAFLFRSSLKNRMKLFIGRHNKNLHKTTIAITVKQLSNNKQINYENVLIQFIDYVTEKLNIQVWLIPQSTSLLHNDDDRVVINRLKRRIRNKTNVIIPDKLFSHYEIKSLYENLDFLVGTRMHSVIFALTGYVPTIAIEYEHKTMGIMEELGLKKWVIPLSNVSSVNLINKFNQLIHEKKSYKAKLKKTLPKYIRTGHKKIRMASKNIINNNFNHILQYK